MADIGPPPGEAGGPKGRTQAASMQRCRDDIVLPILRLPISPFPISPFPISGHSITEFATIEFATI